MCIRDRIISGLVNFEYNSPANVWWGVSGYYPSTTPSLVAHFWVLVPTRPLHMDRSSASYFQVWPKLSLISSSYLVTGLPLVLTAIYGTQLVRVFLHLESGPLTMWPAKLYFSFLTMTSTFLAPVFANKSTNFTLSFSLIRKILLSIAFWIFWIFEIFFSSGPGVQDWAPYVRVG